MNYIYRLNDNNNLVEEFPTDKNYNLVEEVPGEFAEQYKEFYFGYIENYYEKPWKQYAQCWISETQLEILNADGTFKYSIVDSELIESDFDNEAYLLEQAKKEYISLVSLKTDEKLKQGYEVSENQHIQCDDTTITRFNGVLVYREALEYPFAWICRENTEYMIKSSEEFMQIGASLVTYMSTLIREARDTKNSIINANTIEEIKERYNAI